MRQLDLFTPCTSSGGRLSAQTRTPPSFVPEPSEGVEHLIYNALLEPSATTCILELLSTYERTEAARIIREMRVPTIQRGPHARDWGAFIVARAHVLPVEELVNLRELGLDLGQGFARQARQRLAGLPNARWPEAVHAARDGYGYSKGFLAIYERTAAEVLGGVDGEMVAA